MKKLTLILTLICAINLNAQDQPQQTNNNELKLNIGYLLLGLPEFSYERIINDESSFGASLAFSIDEDVDVNYILTPYYRFFFGKKRAAGFFLEGNAAVFNEDYNNTTETAFGLGFGLGGKFLTKSNWTGELLIGLGRTLVNADNTAEAYPRIGVSFGKRF